MTTTLLLAASLLVLGSAMDLKKRIINGDKAELYSHPYIGSLQYNNGEVWYHVCGSSLIDSSWMLTAAHCVDFDSASQFRVELGALDLYDSPNVYEKTYAVAEIIIHQGWSPNAAGMPNDIALLRLASPVTLNNNIKVATLAEEGDSFLGEECVLAGWGMTSTENGGSSPTTLKEVSITKISTSSCNLFWFGRRRGPINQGHICVHDASSASGEKASACMGDSGGPMMCGAGHNILAGVTSWGESTCGGVNPSVYTRVSSYRDWISANIK